MKEVVFQIFNFKLVIQRGQDSFEPRMFLKCRVPLRGVRKRFPPIYFAPEGNAKIV